MTVDGLISALRQGFGALSDHRSKNCRYALADTLMTGFAIFHQKDPSLLAFRDQFPARSANMKTIYGLEKIPEDTGLRECLDGVNPDLLRASFKSLFRAAQSEKLLVKKQVLDKKLVVSFDGTGYFSSTKIHCDHCLTKERSAGSTSYHHQLLGAVVVAPRCNRGNGIAAVCGTDSQRRRSYQERLRAQRAQTAGAESATNS